MRIPLWNCSSGSAIGTSAISLVTSLAIISQKGGVGKTTLCINLAHAFARRGWKTLLIDTDPQGGIGLSLSKNTRSKRGFFDFLSQGGEASGFILRTRLAELSVLPSGEQKEDYGKEHAAHIALALKSLLQEAKNHEFDLVMFDTSAGIHPMNESILRASDWVLLPQQAEPLAARSLPKVLEALSRLKKEGHPTRLAGIVLTMILQNHEASVRVAAELKELLPSALLCETSIPRDNLFLEASAVGLPINLVRKTPPPVSLNFDYLATELEKKLGMQQPPSHSTHESLLD